MGFRKPQVLLAQAVYLATYPQLAAAAVLLVALVVLAVGMATLAQQGKAMLAAHLLAVVTVAVVVVEQEVRVLRLFLMYLPGALVAQVLFQVFQVHQSNTLVVGAVRDTLYLTARAAAATAEPLSITVFRRRLVGLLTQVEAVVGAQA